MNSLLSKESLEIAEEIKANGGGVDMEKLSERDLYTYQCMVSSM